MASLKSNKPLKKNNFLGDLNLWILNAHWRNLMCSKSKLSRHETCCFFVLCQSCVHCSLLKDKPMWYHTGTGLALRTMQQCDCVTVKNETEVESWDLSNDVSLLPAQCLSVPVKNQSEYFIIGTYFHLSYCFKSFDSIPQRQPGLVFLSYMLFAFFILQDQNIHVIHVEH